MTNSIRTFKYIVNYLVATKGKSDGLGVARAGLEVVRVPWLKLASDDKDAQKTVDDLFKTLTKIKATGELEQAETVLDHFSGNAASSGGGQPPFAPLTFPSIYAGGGANGADLNDGACDASLDSGFSQTRDTGSTQERSPAERMQTDAALRRSPGDSATDEGASSMAESVVTESDAETAEDLAGASQDRYPRPGYYLRSPDDAHPERDSEDGKILVVRYTPTDATESDNANSREADRTLILKDFPHAFIPPAANDIFECAVPQEYVYALDRLAQLAHSHFCIVLNEVNGENPTQGGSSINIGHAVIAKWIVQNTTMLRERERDRRVTRGKRASIVAYTAYQFARTSSEFAKPRLFFNRVFLGALGRCSESNKLNALIDKVFTSRAGESHSRVLLNELQLENIRSYFHDVTAMARRVFNKEESDSHKLPDPGDDTSSMKLLRLKTRAFDHRLLEYGDDTFSLELPRLEIKAVLSLVRHLHESRFQKEYHSYETMPLKLTVVGNTLLKQSAVVESKCRQLQPTHLMYIRKEGPEVHVESLVQKLGRIEHEHTDSPFYRSAFPVQKPCRTEGPPC